jgi:hypothetical protein
VLQESPNLDLDAHPVNAHDDMNSAVAVAGINAAIDQLGLTGIRRESADDLGG